MTRILLSTIDPATHESLSRDVKERTKPRKARLTWGSPAELQSLVQDMVGRIADHRHRNALHTAVTRRVSRINAYRSPSARLPKPGKGFVRHLVLEHRRRASAVAGTRRIPVEGSGAATGNGRD